MPQLPLKKNYLARNRNGCGHDATSLTGDMARKRNQTNYQIKCTYFTWIMSQRAGVYQADGRSNQPSAGRHSLHTREYEKAKEHLSVLDAAIATELGLIPAGASKNEKPTSLALREGRDLYLAHIGRSRALKGATASTQKRYRPVFVKAIAFFERRGIRTWHEVGEFELVAYGNWLERHGYAHATQVMEVVTLKQAINHFVDRKLLPPELNFKLELDKVKESTMYCFSPKEVAAMIQYCDANADLRWLADVITALAYTGMRIGELAQLRWSAVDLRGRNIVVVDESRRRTKTGINRRTTKNSRSRTIPILSVLLVVLERLHQTQNEGLVFRARKGGRLRPRNVLQAFIDKVIVPLKDRFPDNDDEPSFEDGRLHSLRHSFCSLCANKQVSELALMEWLGHSGSEMVKRYYHLRDEESHRQMSKVESGDGNGVS